MVKNVTQQKAQARNDKRPHVEHEKHLFEKPKQLKLPEAKDYKQGAKHGRKI